MLTQRLRTAALALCLLAAPVASHAGPYSNLYVFGDSLSDNGSDHNLSAALNAVSGGAFPVVPAPNVSPLGRFGNGLVAVDYLASALNLSLTPHYVTPAFLGGATGGNNYAQGGATSGTTNASLPGTLNLGPAGVVATGFKGVTAEIADYTAVTLHADPNALYVVWSGANDFLHLGSVAPAPGCTGSIAAVAVCTAVTNVTSSVAALLALGATHILVPNLPDLGATPSAIVGGAAAVQQGHDISVAYNAGLAGSLAGLSGFYPGDIIPFDLFGFLNGILADATRYGFTDTTDACLSGSVADATSVVTAACAAAGADHYVFWDDVHPTNAAQTLLGAQLALAVGVPEPSDFALLGIGLMAFVAVRRRSRA